MQEDMQEDSDEIAEKFRSVIKELALLPRWKHDPQLLDFLTSIVELISMIEQDRRNG